MRDEPVPTQKRGARLREGDRTQPAALRTMAVKVGPVVLHRCPCFPDNVLFTNFERAARFRVMQRVGPGKLDLEGLKKFTMRWCERWLRVVGAPLSVEEWLDGRRYPLRRKKEIWEAYLLRVDDHNPRHYRRVNTHIKVECYCGFKDPRLINSRVDAFKAHFGPWCHWMEEIVFALPFFVKHVPVKERPVFVEERLSAYIFKFVTDYRRFESSMRPEIMDAIEFIVYRYFGVPEWMIEVLRRPVLMRGRGFSGTVGGTRMSGEMNTSLGNSLTNLIMFAWWAECNGAVIDSVVEGDDGVHGCDKIPDPAWFLKRGFSVEIKTGPTLGELGFLSTKWAPDGTLLGDPWRLVKLGWTSHLPKASRPSVRRDYFGAIALSLGYELGCSPLFWAIARKYARPGRLRNEYWTLLKLDSFGAKYVVRDEWIHLTGRVKVRPPSRLARETYATLFGITPREQEKIEEQILQGRDIDNAALSVVLDASYPDLVKSYLHCSGV